MEEIAIQEILKKFDSKIVGLLTVILTVLILILKNVKNLKKLFEIIYTERVFETYNNKLKIVAEKNVTFTIKTLTLRSDSEDIFEFMKSAYDLSNRTNTDNKSLRFKLYELSDNEILLSNLIKFLDYYRLKNGVKVFIFLQDSKNNGIKKQVRDYIDSLNIKGAKVV